MTPMPRSAPARRLFLLLALTIATAAGCSEATAVPDVPISAVAVPQGIRITNHATVEACYSVIEQGTLALLDLSAPMCGPSAAGPRVAPGQQVLVVWSQILGFHPTRTEFVIYWRLSGQGEVGSVVVSSAGVDVEP